MSTQPNKNTNSNNQEELEANIDPGANTGHLIADTLKDHTKGVNAVLFEIVQNSIGDILPVVNDGASYTVGMSVSRRWQWNRIRNGFLFNGRR
jgi:hypothetical protein